MEGVYAVGHTVLTREGRWMAAVLSAGPGAVLSHRSAAALWGIRPTASPRIEITAPGLRRPRQNLLPDCAALADDETATTDGIPVTTPARTLLGLAAVLPPNELDRALIEAETRRLQGPQHPLERHGNPGGAVHSEAPWRPSSSTSSGPTTSPSPRRTRSSMATRSTSCGESPG